MADDDGTSMGGETKFAKLTRDNYWTWHKSMKMYLVTHGLDGVVFGTESRPLGGDDTKAVKAWAQKKRHAWGQMGLRVDGSQLGYFDDLEDEPGQVWKKLESVHEPRGLATAVALKARLGVLRRDPTKQTVHDYVSEIEEIRQRLAQQKMPASDAEIIAALMRQPNSYAPLIVTLDFVDKDQLTPEFVITRLLNEEARQVGVKLLGEKKRLVASADDFHAPGTDQDLNSDGHNAGLAATARRPKRDVKDITCFNCLEKGHYMSDCEEPKRVKLKDSKNPSAGLAWVTSSKQSYDLDHSL